MATFHCAMAKLSQSDAQRTHNMSGHPAYRSWNGVWARCTNRKNPDWKSYGGRGIKVCKRWGEFETFWADMGPTWKPGLALCRKNIDGNYTKRNCHWAADVH
jgi:hypothetical protein